MSEGAQIEREASIEQDADYVAIKHLVRTGVTQGLSKEEVRNLLDALEVRYVIKPPVYAPSLSSEINAHHGGQADVVKFLKYHCGEIKYGE